MTSSPLLNSSTLTEGELKTTFDPLNDDQIEYAKELLEELHPLEKTPYREAFPWLGVVTCYNKAAVSDNYQKADNEAGEPKNNVIKMSNGKEVVKKTPKKKKQPLGDDALNSNPIA